MNCIELFPLHDIAAFVAILGCACFAFGFAAGQDVGEKAGEFRGREEMLAMLNPRVPEPTGLHLEEGDGR